VLEYHRAATKTRVELAMALVMSHGEHVDWEKVNSYFLKIGTLLLDQAITLSMCITRMHIAVRESQIV
jgi:hypothetical protein